MLADGTLFDLHNNGCLDVREPYTGGSSEIDSGIVSIGVSNGTLFDLHGSGQLYVRDIFTGAFYGIDSGVVSIGVNGMVDLFDLHGSGQLDTRDIFTGAFTLLATGVCEFVPRLCSRSTSFNRTARCGRIRRRGGPCWFKTSKPSG